MNYYLLLKTGRLLVGTIVLALIVGTSPAFATDHDGLTPTADPPTLPTASISALANVIDFEACVTGSPSYMEDGALVTPLGGTSLLCTTSPNTSIGAIGQLVGSPLVPLRTDLGCTTNMVTADIGDFNADADLLFLEAYNIGDGLVDSDTFLIPAPFVGMITLSVSGPGIVYVLTGANDPSSGGDSVFTDNITFECLRAVGGEFLGVDTTAVLVSGAQYTAAWMIPVIVSGIGIAIVIARKF